MDARALSGLAARAPRGQMLLGGRSCRSEKWLGAGAIRSRKETAANSCGAGTVGKLLTSGVTEHKSQQRLHLSGVLPEWACSPVAPCSCATWSWSTASDCAWPEGCPWSPIAARLAPSAGSHDMEAATAPRTGSSTARTRRRATRRNFTDHESGAQVTSTDQSNIIKFATSRTPATARWSSMAGERLGHWHAHLEPRPWPERRSCIRPRGHQLMKPR